MDGVRDGPFAVPDAGGEDTSSCFRAELSRPAGMSSGLGINSGITEVGGDLCGDLWMSSAVRVFFEVPSGPGHLRFFAPVLHADVAASLASPAALKAKMLAHTITTGTPTFG